MSHNDPYPGSNAEPEDILDLAEAYYEAAISLLEVGKKVDKLRYAPARLCSIHAIELFLNAFLRHGGAAPELVRSRLHNLADDSFVKALRLRQKTALHLDEMTKRREYLISRYAPEAVSQHTELNRLRASLEEIRKKTSAHICAALSKPAG